jgi:hypothetical protein
MWRFATRSRRGRGFRRRRCWRRGEGEDFIGAWHHGFQDAGRVSRRRNPLLQRM